MNEKLKQLNYPVILQKDRYGGTYSGGEWILINDMEAMESGGYDGSDVVCSNFWDMANRLDWKIGKGNTPEDALNNLLNKYKQKNG